MRILAAVVALVPSLVVAQGVSRATKPPPEYLFFQEYRNAAMSAALNIGGRNVPAGSVFEVTRAEAQLTANSGGGAGNTVITLSDGTNSCTLTWACATTQTGSGKTVAAVVAAGGGTGCRFAPSANGILITVSTAGCTSTQPTYAVISIFGLWR